MFYTKYYKSDTLCSQFVHIINCVLDFPAGDSNGTPQPFKLAKNDLIAELKLSHNVGGVSKLRSEQQKIQEEQERAEYRRFLAQFTMENFLEKVRRSR